MNRNRLQHAAVALIVILSAGWATIDHARAEPSALLGGGCRTPDGVAYNLRMGLFSAMNRTDSMADVVIAARGVTRVSSSQVIAVTDTVICRRAANAYSAAINAADSNRFVHAVQVGIRYVVLDPTADRTGGGWMLGITFDSSFTQVYRKFAF